MAGFSDCCLLFVGWIGLYVRSSVLNVICFVMLMVSNAVEGASFGI